MENYKESLEYKFAEAWVQPESEDNVRALERYHNCLGFNDAYCYNYIVELVGNSPELIEHAFKKALLFITSGHNYYNLIVGSETSEYLRKTKEDRLDGRKNICVRKCEALYAAGIYAEPAKPSERIFVRALANVHPTVYQDMSSIVFLIIRNKYSSGNLAKFDINALLTHPATSDLFGGDAAYCMNTYVNSPFI